MMSSRDHPCCETYADACHQAPPGYFAVESGDDDCAGCALHDGSDCRRTHWFGEDAARKYPCEFEDHDNETTVYFRFRPVSEWKFGNEEGESP